MKKVMFHVRVPCQEPADEAITLHTRIQRSPQAWAAESRCPTTAQTSPRKKSCACGPLRTTTVHPTPVAAAAAADPRTWQRHAPQQLWPVSPRPWTTIWTSTKHQRREAGQVTVTDPKDPQKTAPMSTKLDGRSSLNWCGCPQAPGTDTSRPYHKAFIQTSSLLPIGASFTQPQEIGDPSPRYLHRIGYGSGEQFHQPCTGHQEFFFRIKQVSKPSPLVDNGGFKGPNFSP